MQCLLHDGVDVEQRPCAWVGLRARLSGLMEEDRGAWVERIARGGFICGGPARQSLPDADAPGVVALQNQGGVPPAGGCFKQDKELTQLDVRERKVVEVGTAARAGVSAGNATPDARAMGDGQMEKDEVGLVGLKELDGMLLQVEPGAQPLSDIVVTEGTL